MTHDAAFLIDDQSLRNRSSAVRQRMCEFAVGEAETKSKTHFAGEPLHTLALVTRIFHRQADEDHVVVGVTAAHLLILRNFATAWATPRSPDVYHHDLAVEVGQAKVLIVE